jgi:hypothetical protein
VEGALFVLPGRRLRRWVEQVGSFLAAHVDVGEQPLVTDPREGVIDQVNPLGYRRLHLADHAAARGHLHRLDVALCGALDVRLW